jgi:type IV pilus secretin PilQ/predicted competence protein
MMRKIFCWITILIFCVNIFAQETVVSTKDVSTNEINELSDIKVEDNTVVLTFSLKPTITDFYLDNPPRVVVDVKDCKIAKDVIEKKFPQNPFIARIRTSQFETKPKKIVRIVIDLVNKTNYEINIQENVLKVFIKKGEIKVKSSNDLNTKSSSEKQEISSGKSILPTMIVNLEYDEADMSDVLQMLAIKSGLNIIYGPDVTGTITISLKNVPFNKAFETILRLKGLVYVPISENIIRVATPSTLENERSQQIVYTKIFPLNYVLAEDVKTQLDSIRTAENRTKGAISADKQTNSLIVTETEEGLSFIEEWIKKLDQKPPQVSIEAQVIDISIDDLKEIGVDWSYTQLETKPGAGIDYTINPRVRIGDATFTGTVNELGVKQADINVGFPATGVAFQFGYMTNSMLLTSKLAALISQGRAKVLSNPRVTTMSNKTATLLAGEKVPYKTTTVSAGGTATESWQFLDAGVKLTVTPVVSPDKWVTLTVSPEVSVPQPAAPGAAPTVRTRNTQVTVMVKNNETLVIGGLISDSDIETIQKVPLLGDLPILGYFFKYKSNTKRRSELVILITPRIVED